jgi:hypothetical protein
MVADKRLLIPIIAVSIIGATVLAQDPAPHPHQAIVSFTLVMPVPGAPLSVEIASKALALRPTVDDQPSMVGIEETWAAGQLGLFGMLKSSDPNLEATARIRHWDRHDPDPELFKIPPDYLIQDLKSDDPTQ